jgi:hypothetical protein
LDHAAPTTRQRRPRARERSLRTFFRDTVVGGASIGVLALLVAYAVAAPTAELNADVGPTVPRPGPTAVVQGRVLEAGGGGLDGAQIEVRAAGRQAESATSDDSGSFRVELSGGCAAYDISLLARADGETLRAATHRRLCPGDALPVDARVVTHGHFLWVPGPR